MAEIEFSNGVDGLNTDLKNLVDLWSAEGGGGAFQQDVIKVVTEGFERGYEMVVEFLEPDDKNKQYVDQFEAKEITPEGFIRILIKSIDYEKLRKRPYASFPENGEGFRAVNAKDEVVVIYPSEIVSLKFVMPVAGE